MIIKFNYNCRLLVIRIDFFNEKYWIIITLKTLITLTSIVFYEFYLSVLLYLIKLQLLQNYFGETFGIICITRLHMQSNIDTRTEVF